MLSIWFSRAMFALALFLFLVLQYILWFGYGGLVSVMQFNGLIAEQKIISLSHKKRNQHLVQHINALRHDPQAIESLARSELGMIKSGETLFRIVS